MVLMVRLFVAGIGVQKNEKYISLDFSIIFIAVGIFVMSGVFSDILLMVIIEDANKFKNWEIYIK
ncbi:hypothetical protein [Aliarcobacter lanthieri]|uniref:hypothetical protein n=1 Tax=Aliarcobacter lanthieri TaxID=1355374 RepID=UPI00047B0B90|nr:hypothetical protein [Aliarcobacter lanthieri]QKF59257.1 hypothetical protein ALANTH_1148 [Aliarcobacter lanthieri]